MMSDARLYQESKTRYGRIRTSPSAGHRPLDTRAAETIHIPSLGDERNILAVDDEIGWTASYAGRPVPSPGS